VTVTVAGTVALNVTVEDAAASRPPAAARPLNMNASARTLEVSFGKVAARLGDQGQLKIDLASARVRRVHVTLDVSNGESKPVQVVGQQQTLVTDDKKKHSAQQASFSIAAHGRRKVALTFLVAGDRAPSSLVLRIGNRARSIQLTVARQAKGP
jgi:hypothetical protein